MNALTTGDSFRRVTVFLSRIGLVLLLINLPLALFSAATMPFSLILLLLAAQMISQLLQLALSRRREFAADIGAAELTGESLALASALKKISRRRTSFWGPYMIVPRENTEIFRTHPNNEERIRRLRELHGPRPIHPFGQGLRSYS